MSSNPEANLIIRQVPVQSAFRWVRQGINAFKRYTVMWAILFVIYFAVIQLLGLLPVFGVFLGILLAQVFTGGLMIGSDAVSRGQDLEINHLFAGFKLPRPGLIKLGFYYIAALMVLSVAFSLSLDQETIASMQQGQPPSLQNLDWKTMEKPLMLIGLLAVPIAMAFWFAPALIAIDQQTPLQALKLSLMACIKNILPLIVYSVLFALVFVALFNIAQSMGELFQGLVMTVAMVIIFPIMMTSLHNSYREIFVATEND